MAQNERIDRGTLVDDIAQRLRILILSGQIPPGQHIRIRDLQERFGVSHIPVREALRSLEGEGLVETKPRRGAVAAQVSVELLDEVYDARRLLEPPILKRAVARMTDIDRAALKAALEKMERAEKGAYPQFFDAHRDFHWQLLQAGSTDTLERVIRQLWSVAERFVRGSKIAFPGDVEVARRQHRELFEMVSSGNTKAAKVLSEHLYVTQHAIRAHAKQTGAL